ncbi:MAG: tRNA (guanosine(37)-N1)-methyltransferase TrmD [Patescibacteria group bacterium]
MKISILTLFPEMFQGPLDYSIVKRAKEKGLVKINLVNIRDFASDTYKTVDDHPYGGGTGMIMKVDVIDRAIEYAKTSYLHSVIPAQAGIHQEGTKKLDPRFRGDDTIRTILLDPRGTPYTQTKARKLSKLDHLILVCGHYEGVDERVGSLVDERIAIGRYILTGGELGAMIIADSVIRLIPGVLSKSDATLNESFSETMKLEHPQYTNPRTYKRHSVPSVLLSGDHKKIYRWRKDNAISA